MTPTGKKRYRVQRTIFGKEYLVLQMEIKHTVFLYPDLEDVYYEWVDAKPEWLTEFVE